MISRLFLGIILVTCALGITKFVFAQSSSQRVTRFELSQLLEEVQCRDCLVPDQQTKETYTADRLAQQMQDPQVALDDLVFEKTPFEGKDYYYCVASVVDRRVMNGFPKGTSPYCPGKFCGSSYVTFAELIEASIRLLGNTLREVYPVDWQSVGVRANDNTDVTVQERGNIINALKRCGSTDCPAAARGEFDARLHRCAQQDAPSTGEAFCGFSSFPDFPAGSRLTAKLSVLVNAQVVSQDETSTHRYALLTRDQITAILDRVQAKLTCDRPLQKDYDTDGVPNSSDLCPNAYDPQQKDYDADGIGDVCDDDIDGDGVTNVPGVVDAQGSLVPALVKQSEDNCVLTKNGDQQNSQDALLGDACNPTLSTNSSNGQAIQVGGRPLVGHAPLLVAFTSSIIGSPDKLLRDFGDSFLTQGSAPTHLFTQAGTYTVIVKALFGNQTVVGMLPVLVGTDLSLQAGLEAVTKQLIAGVGDKINLEHALIGPIQKLVWTIDGQLLTVDPKQVTTYTPTRAGIHKAQLQAYNTAGQRVALSQLTIDVGAGRGSSLHASSLDPDIGQEVIFSTVIGGFTSEEILRAEREFGDGTTVQTTQGAALHVWKQPGVYLVKEHLIFRDVTKQEHENLLTIMVHEIETGAALTLGVDELVKEVGKEFLFRLDLQNMQSVDLSQCTRHFGDQTSKTVSPVTPGSLLQKKAYTQPGSYLVDVMCLDKGRQWYSAAITVAVTPSMVCLTAPQTLKCDMDKDGLADLCDDDIDGDGQSNRMGLISFERADCSVDTGNTNQQLVDSSHGACQGGAVLDNCPFVTNDTQTDADADGVGAACDPDDNNPDLPYPQSPNEQTVVGGTTAGGGDGGPAGGNNGNTSDAPGGGDTGGGETPGTTPTGSNGDDDGDGILNGTDACGGTPESSNGSQDSDGCPEAPADASNDDTPNNPFIQIEDCTQCPCPEADYASALRKGDRVRAMLLDPGGTIIYRYSQPEIIEKDIPNQMLGIVPKGEIE